MSTQDQINRELHRQEKEAERVRQRDAAKVVAEQEVKAEMDLLDRLKAKQAELLANRANAKTARLNSDMESLVAELENLGKPNNVELVRETRKALERLRDDNEADFDKADGLREEVAESRRKRFEKPKPKPPTDGQPVDPEAPADAEADPPVDPPSNP